MKVKNTVPFDSKAIINFYSDDFSVIVLSAPANSINIRSFDLENLNAMAQFPIESEPNEHFDACLDDDCIYISTKWGQILAIDKFSGHILATINTAMPAMSNLICDDSNIYCVCGIPLSRKWNLVTDRFSACVFDKNSGEKKVQTNYFTANNFEIAVTKDYIWIVAGTYLLRYSKDGALSGSAVIPGATNYPPICTENHIMLASEIGSLHIFDQKTMLLDATINADPNVSGPILFQDKIIWHSNDGTCIVNYKERVFHSKKSNRTIKESVLGKNHLFGCDEKGYVVSFDLESEEFASIKLSEEALKNPIFSDNHLLVMSPNQLHLIET